MNSKLLFTALLASGFSALLGTSALAAAVLGATLDDSTLSPARKLRGGQIDYSVLISNTGDANATSVTLTNPTPANTTDIAGSLRVTPIAADDAYTDIVGNTQRTVAAATGLLANDFDPDGAPGSVVVKAGSVSRVSGTATGGVLVAAADGSFLYTPGVGQTGIERFQYTITDSQGLDSVTVGFVDFTINAPRVWYVQNGTTNGDGRSHSPFNSLASASTAANAATDTIYVFADIGANAKLNGNVVLETGQQLLGQGVALIVNTLTLFPAGAAPTLTNTAGDVVTLASGNTVRGLLIGNHPTGTGISGASVGALTINSITINGTGKIVDLTGIAGNSVAITLDNATTTSSTSEGIRLVGLIGNVTVTAGAISGAAGADVLISGGTANLSFGNTITNTAGRSVDIQNKTGGTVAFSGAISDTGTGIFLNANGGATVNFTGGLNISTGANPAFTATGGGSVSATQNNTTVVNTLTTTTGAALNVANTTIGVGGLTFRSISANGAASGIVLNATGTSGAFTISGNGAAGTGGTILNSTSDSVVLTSTDSPSLNWFNITDSAGTGADDGIVMTNITGTVTVDRCVITSVPHNGMTVDNFNTNMAAFNFTNSTIQCSAGAPCQPSGSIGNDGLLLVMRGTSVLTSGVISGSTFSGVRAVGVQIQTNDSGRIGVNSGTVTTTTLTTANSITVQSNTFTGNGQGIDIGTSQVSNLSFQVLNNSIVGKVTAPGAISNQSSATAINAFTAAGADTGPTSHAFVGKIDTNFIGTQGVKDSGAGFGNGIRAVIQGVATQSAITINNNTIREVPNASLINIFAQNGAAATGFGSARFKITNNTMPQPTGSNLGLCGPLNTACADSGIFMLADENGIGQALITGNTIYDLSLMNGSFDIYLAQRDGPPANALLRIEGTGSVSSYILANNTLTGAAKFIDEGAGSGNPSTLVAIGSAGTYPLLFAPGGVALAVPDLADYNARLLASKNCPCGCKRAWATQGEAAPIGSPIAPAGISAPAGGVEKAMPAEASRSVFDQSQTLPEASGAVFNPSQALSEASRTVLNPSQTFPAASRTAFDPSRTSAEASGTALDRSQTPPESSGAISFSSEPAARRGAEGTLLDRRALEATVSAALARWEATGLSGEQLAALRAVSFEVADLPGWYLGEANGTHLRVDRDAGGNGWFIDATPLEDEEFAATPAVAATPSSQLPPRLYTTPTGAPAGRIDLLTTLLHEMGHALGLPDGYAATDRDGVMFGYLTKGERRLPAKRDAFAASVLGGEPHAHAHFLAGPVAIGTLPPGKIVRITYSVTIAAALPPGVGAITNTGTVTATSGISVVTDDAEFAGQQATATPVSVPPIITNAPKPGTEDVTVTFTAADFTGHYTDANSDGLLSGTIITLPANGTLKVSGVNATAGQVVLAANLGTITFVPDLNYNGAATFNWNASDGSFVAEAIAAVNITLAAVNDAPIITGQTPISTPEDTARAIVFTDLTVTDVDNTYPTGFTLTVLAGANYTFVGNTITPILNYNGPLTVPVKVNDGGLDSNTFNLTVTVTPVNDAPVITGQNPVSTPEETPRTIVFADLLVADPDNAYPAGFTLTVQNGANYNRAGNTITPVLNFNGILIVPVTVTDPATAVSNIFNLNVTVTGVNDAPVITAQAAPIALAANHSRTIVFTDLTVTDPDNTYPTGFTLTVSNGANYTRVSNIITPTPGFVGTLSVPVQINDSAANSNVFNLTVTVNPTAEQVATNTTIVPEAGGGFRFSSLGTPGATYSIQFTNSLLPANWQPLGSVAADATGHYSMVDIPPANTPMRYYRAVEPYLNSFLNGLGKATLRGTAVLGNGGVKLTDEVTGGFGAVVFDGLAATPALTGFTARFNLALGPGTIPPADGAAFAVGNLGAGAWGETGPATANSLAVGFDTYDNGSADGNIGIHVWVNGAHLAVSATNPYTNGATVPVEIIYDTATGLTVRYNSVLIFTNLPIPGLTFPAAGGFGIGARTGGLLERAVVDDVEITPRP